MAKAEKLNSEKEKQAEVRATTPHTAVTLNVKILLQPHQKYPITQ